MHSVLSSDTKGLVAFNRNFSRWFQTRGPFRISQRSTNVDDTVFGQVDADNETPNKPGNPPVFCPARFGAKHNAQHFDGSVNVDLKAVRRSTGVSLKLGD